MAIEAPWTTPTPKQSWKESFEGGDPAVDSQSETVIVTAAAIGAGVLTNRVLKAAWKRWVGSEPPINPAAEEITWSEAMIWAASVGAAIGVSKAFTRRGVTAAVRKVR